MNRLVYVDIAKGIAIILVVIGHILQFNLSGTSKNILFNWIYAFHMPVFMMLSGYVSAYKADQISLSSSFKQVRKKFSQLIIPFLIWGSIIMPMIKNYSIYDWGENFVNLINSPHIGAWFLLSLFFIHLYFIIGINISNKIKVPYSDFIGSIIVFIIICLLGQYFTFYSLDNSFYFPIKYYLMYLFGYFCNKYFQKLVFSQTITIISLVVFSLLINKYDFASSSSILQILISIPASIILINLSQYLEKTQIINEKAFKNKINDYLICLGKNSLVIYLVHIPFIVIVNNQINSDLITPPFLFICCLLIAIIICYICIGIGDLCKYCPCLNKVLFGK